MAKLLEGRYAAEIDGDFVVFLIGMRINSLLAVHKWGPVAVAMPGMISELKKNPALGLLGVRAFLSGRTIMNVQYWRSFEHLHAYAHARDKAHLPAWAAFNRAAQNNAAVGVFHESYLVPAGSFECVYVNMPPTGLGEASRTVPALGRMNSARERLRQPAEDSGSPELQPAASSPGTSTQPAPPPTHGE